MAIKKIEDLLTDVWRGDTHTYWVSATSPSQSGSSGEARFQLRCAGQVIGILERRGSVWMFRYTDEFRELGDFRALVEFPDTGKEYQTSELWPFFGMRIPSLKQPRVREILQREKIDPHSEVDLLRRFGRRTTANPFELVEE